MVEVPRADGGSYCVDATEVTNAKYEQFLAASPSTSAQPPGCEWDSTYVPAYGWPGGPNLPVVNVDWCDAFAYCAWAGKRLCGAVDGGTVPLSEASQSAQSQWYMACSRGGERDFPYGSQPDGMACNSYGMEPVASSPCCEGGYDGIFDMAGNVAEWEDACAGNSESDECLVRDVFLGGVGCYYGEAVPRNVVAGILGFRCCSP